jgi:hypothetical protein
LITKLIKKFKNTVDRFRSYDYDMKLIDWPCGSWMVASGSRICVQRRHNARATFVLVGRMVDSSRVALTENVEWPDNWYVNRHGRRE